MPTWLVVGASRGIGLEFVRQLLAHGEQVIATVRDPSNAAEIWSMAGAAPMGACRLLLCDVASDELSSVSTCLGYVLPLAPDWDQTFVREIQAFRGLERLDYVVMNAGINKFPNVHRTCQLPPW